MALGYGLKLGGQDWEVERDKTQYYSISPTAWTARYPSADNVTIVGERIEANVDGKVLVCPVNLPHGATVVSVIVYGAGGAAVESWSFMASTMNYSGNFTVATALLNSSAVASSAGDRNIIDNTTYHYFLSVESLEDNDQVRGGLITYTIPYDFKDKPIKF